MKSKEDMNSIELHSAGATVRTKTPFDDIPTFKTDFEVTKEFVEKWVLKFYMKDVDSSIFQNQFKLIKNELNEDIVRTLLGDFNWRTRKVGAIFTIVKNYSQFEEIIGNHLLKSEVCYAGRFYALALAYINTDSSVRFLKQYLEYYLTRHDLDFDQVIVMNALVYLDAKNNTKVHESLLSLWHDYITPINQTREESYNKHPQYYPKGFIPFDLEANEWITRTLDSYIKLGNM